MYEFKNLNFYEGSQIYYKPRNCQIEMMRYQPLRQLIEFLESFLITKTDLLYKKNIAEETQNYSALPFTITFADSARVIEAFGLHKPVAFPVASLNPSIMP